MSGGRLSECATEENPCRQAYIDYLGFGDWKPEILSSDSKFMISGVARPSWDPLTTLFAVRGAGGIGCKEEGFGGHNLVGEEGGNSWVEGDGGKNMSYLVLEEGEDIRIGDVIDDLLCATSAR